MDQKTSYYKLASEFIKNQLGMSFDEMPEEYAIRLQNGQMLYLHTPYENSERTKFVNWQQDLVDYLQTSLQIVDAKPETFEDVKTRILPQLKTVDQISAINDSEPMKAAEDMLVTREFVHTLNICFVIDTEKGYLYITKNKLEEFGIDINELTRLAIKNLAELPASKEGPRKMDHKDGTFSYSWESNDGYDAARILLPNLWDMFSPFYPDGFLIAIPHRDFLLVTPVAFLQQLTQYSNELYNKFAHPVYSGVLMRVPEGFTYVT